MTFETNVYAITDINILADDLIRKTSFVQANTNSQNKTIYEMGNGKNKNLVIETKIEIATETEAVIEDEIKTENVTETAVEDEIKTEIVTEIAVEAETKAENVTETAVEDEIKTENVTETALEDETKAENVTETAVEDEIKTENVTETALEDEIKTENVTETALEDETKAENVTETAVENDIKIETETKSEGGYEAETSKTVAIDVTRVDLLSKEGSIKGKQKDYTIRSVYSNESQNKKIESELSQNTELTKNDINIVNEANFLQNITESKIEGFYVEKVENLSEDFIKGVDIGKFQV